MTNKMLTRTHNSHARRTTAHPVPCKPEVVDYVARKTGFAADQIQSVLDNAQINANRWTPEELVGVFNLVHTMRAKRAERSHKPS